MGGIILVVLVFWLLNGGLPSFLSGGDQPDAEAIEGVPEDEPAEFVSVILGSTEDEWSEIFREMGRTYRAPELVLFDNQVSSACGFQSSAAGPFYCPPDQKVYIDLGFFSDLARMGGPGDFAAAYVVGHEVGHHVQNLLGISDRVQQARAGATQGEANALSVRLELQADCYAGVWANRTDRRGIVALSPGDVDEGLDAARAIGDDRIQRRTGRTIHPESFTHGSSEQRAKWLRQGLQTGAVSSCDTFAGSI